MTVQDQLNALMESGRLPAGIAANLQGFYDSFVAEAAKGASSVEDSTQMWSWYVEEVARQFTNPATFHPFHQHVTKPDNYYAFGLDFIRPLVPLDQCEVLGKDALREMDAALDRKENVILLGNHQSEIDPQVLSLLLEAEHPRMARDVVFVAGNRVTEDPIAIPFSLGRNLLCIYSKRHIHEPPEDRERKQLHNQKTMKLMSSMLEEGGVCIYVAPSGGRDRVADDGSLRPAPFDASSLQFFILMAQNAGTPTHFYPLALRTHDLLPPPTEVLTELGEPRIVNYTDVHIGFGPKIDLDNYPGADQENKRARRQARADHIYELVRSTYNRLGPTDNDS